MSALNAYLDYYEKLEEPGYAVLVTGEWGIGKSYQVKEAIPDQRRYYVSLFGMQSTADVFSAVFAAMNPILARIKGGAEESKSAAILGIPVGALGQQIAKTIITENVEKDRTIIFDDLERSKINPTDLLGVINRYIEHHKCRVVVIAHNSKLTEEFREQKEKIFGREIRVDPDVLSAYDAFTAKLEINLNKKDAAALVEFKELILNVRKDAAVNSLRILQHVMEDVARLYSCVAPEYRDDTDAMAELLGSFAALSFECRSERVTERDLLEAGFESGSLSKAAQRYRTDIRSRMLSDRTKVAMLFNGVFDSEAVGADLRNAVQYTPPQEIPAWKVFMEFERETDEVVQPAIKALEEQFERRELRGAGEMLHLLSLRLMMAHHSFIDSSIEEATNECCQYIDDLLDLDLLEPIPLEGEEKQLTKGGAWGYAFWVEEEFKDNFEKVFDHLYNCRSRALTQRFPQYFDEILDLVRSDGRLFRDAINASVGGGKFAAVPILRAINAKDFADAWYSSHPKEWYPIASGISTRLRVRPFEGDNNEKPWAEEVARHLWENASDASVLLRFRIARALKQIPQIALPEGCVV